MRIERVFVDGFGTLAGYDTGADPLPGLVVVYGPNEAGKSTLFHFLTTVLYGFRPASRDGNPYVPWGSDEAGGRVVLKLDAERCVEVERRLRSQPGGQMTLDGRSEDLRNRPLPWVGHIPRTVFSQVFALRLQDLAGLDEETWGKVQDRILGSMGASDLLPTREVAAALESEAGELWRPNRRGKQRVRELRHEAHELRALQKEALDRDRRMRAAVAERDDARRRLEELREERNGARLRLERLQELAPLARRLRRIDELVKAAGPSGPLEGLPLRPDEHRAKLLERLRELEAAVAELSAEEAGPREIAEAFGEREHRMLERDHEVSEFLGRVRALATDRARHRALEQEIADFDRRLGTAASKVLTVPWADAPTERLSALSLPQLEASVRRAEAARRGREAEPSAGTGPGTARLAGGVLALGAGGTLLGFGLTSGPWWLGGAGALSMAGGLALLFRPRPGGPAALSPVPAEGSSVRAEAEAVRALLEGLPILPPLLTAPDATLVAGLQRLVELAEDRAERVHALAEIERRLAELDEAAARTAESFEVGSGPEAEVVATVLERELRRAEKAAEASSHARRELGRIDREGSRLRTEAGRVRDELATLEERASRLGGGDLELGLARARERLEARELARQLTEELERDHPDLDELRDRLARTEEEEGTLAPGDDEVTRRRLRIEGLGETIEELTALAERLDAEVERLASLDTVDAVDGRIAALKVEITGLVRARDRRWVLAQLLREADRRFREEHQPDLMRRASSYLSHLTEGRYQRIVAEESGGSGDVFHVVGETLPAPLPLTPPVSTGTLEQAYLALRLAIVDHLDQGGERLPLFIDEVFVNWDPERRARGLDVLGGLSGSRQLFVFTCHPDVAGDLEERGGRILHLGA